MIVPHKILKPCPFCGVVPTIRRDEWKDINETAGIYVLEANHRKRCFFRLLNGMNATGKKSSHSLRLLEETWNKRISEDD